MLYGQAGAALRAFAERHGIPVAETQAGKSSLPWDHPLQLGAIGVTGSPAANALASEADLVLAVGTRLQDFTTGSNSLFARAELVSLNVNAFRCPETPWPRCAGRCHAGPARTVGACCDDWASSARMAGTGAARSAPAGAKPCTAITGKREVAGLPYDGEVIGAVQRSSSTSTANDIVVCAAGTLPAELHKLWRTSTPGGYHMEYGYSCMGYEIAGGLGVKMAKPGSDVIVMVGDGSYLMMNSEIATSVMLDKKLIIVVLDNRGYGCINRLQQACGNAPFNNMLADCLQEGEGAPQIDFALHAKSLGALSEHVDGIAGLEAGAGARPRRQPHLSDLHRYRRHAHHRRGRLLVGSGGTRSVDPGRRASGTRPL